MYDVRFIDAATGDTIGEAPRERGLPSMGAELVLEHPVFGPVDYRVTRAPRHYYTGRRGALAKPDQYVGTGVLVYVQRLDDDGSRRGR